MNQVDTLVLIALIAVLVAAALTDMRRRRIPNILTLSTMLMGMAFHTLKNGADGFLFSVEGLTVGIAVLIVPYLMGGMGAGDVKLMGAVGAVLGPKGALVAFLFTALTGGVYALALLVTGGLFRERIKAWAASLLFMVLSRGAVRSVPSPVKKGEPVLCYGVAVAVGTGFSLLWSLVA